jgi:pimeloyl-ACP methyl ester carboxylesterase
MITTTGVAAVAMNSRAARAADGAKTYVLVHGAWHGGWCWRDVARPLRAAGHTVFVPTLTGMGERAHLMSRSVNLTTHVTDVVNLFKFEELDNVILVGHSYAGHILPMVADRIAKRIRHSVYLDANIGRDGKSFLPPEEVARRAAIAVDGYQLAPQDPTWFGIPADHPSMPWVKRHLTTHSLNCLAETVRLPNGGDSGIPKTFIRCLKRRDMSQPDAVEPMVKGQPDWTWLTLDTGHDAMVTMPTELTQMLLAIG